MSIEIKCEGCNAIIRKGDQFYQVQLSIIPNDVIIEPYPPDRSQYCSDCMDKMMDYMEEEKKLEGQIDHADFLMNQEKEEMVVDIQKEVMSKFDELVKDLKKEKENE